MRATPLEFGQLVTQGDITVSRNQVPLINAQDRPDIIAEKIVNFLRSGCPSVQVYISHTAYSEDGVQDIQVELVRLIQLCSLEFERMQFTTKTHGKDTLIMFSLYTA